MKKWKKELAAGLILLLALTLFCYTLSAVMIPKRHSFGSNWNAFLAEEKDSLDVLYFGSSLSYCNIIPALVWQDSGIGSYVMAGPEQIPAATYYYVRETLKTQKPQAVVMEVTGVFFPRYTNFTKVNIGYMPWGENRIAATFKASEPEQRLGLMFPLYNYHDRWHELPKMDWTVLWKHTPDPLAGYTYLAECTKVEGVKTRPVTFDRENYEDNIEWLRRIAEYCADHDVKTVFYLSPSYYRLEQKYVDMLTADLPDGVVFRDFNADFDTLGLDASTDFFDYMHYNYHGAEKFSGIMAEWLSALGITPSAEGSSLWQTRLDAFEARKEKQP